MCRLSVAFLLLTSFSVLMAASCGVAAEPLGEGASTPAPAATPKPADALDLSTLQWDALRPADPDCSEQEKAFAPYAAVPVEKRSVNDMQQCAALDLPTVDHWLLEVLESSQASTAERQYAAYALGRRGTPASIVPLCKILGSSDEDMPLRASAVEALGVLLSSHAVPVLIKALVSDDQILRNMSSDALLLLRSEAVVNALVTVAEAKDANYTNGHVEVLSRALRGVLDPRCERAFLSLQKRFPKALPAELTWPASDAKPLRVLWRDTLGALRPRWADPATRASLTRTELRTYAVALLDEARFYEARKRPVSARCALQRMFDVMRQWANVVPENLEDFFFILAAMADAAGDRAAAFDLYARISGVQPDTPLGAEAALRAGSALVRQMKIDEAVAWFEALHKRMPDSDAGRDARLRSLYVLYRNKRYKEAYALAHATEALYAPRNVPTAIKAAMLRILCIEAFKELTRAGLEYLALAANPAYKAALSEALFRAADCFERAGDAPKAKEILGHSAIQAGTDMWAKLGRDRLRQIEAAAKNAASDKH